MNADQARRLYECMTRLRRFEQRVSKLFAAGELPGFVHLYVGQEAVAAGVSAHLRPDDYVTSTHRGHGHALAKGMSMRGLLAEIYGRVDGVCRGKGGSMHVADMSVGMLGANGIVGAGPPLACGAALRAKLSGTDQVSVCYFGDGATAQGTMHETMNLASIWGLPMIFLCENNGVSEATPIEYYSSVTTLADRAAGYAMRGVTVDGMDAEAVFEAAEETIARARAGEPTFFEARTWRYHGHYEGDQMAYRLKEEDAAHRERDAIATFRDRIEGSLVSADELNAIDAAADAEVEDAVAFARASAEPSPGETFAGVYASYPHAQLVAQSA